MTTKKQATLSIQIESQLKVATEDTLEIMGLTYSDAITMLSKAIVNEGKIPFEIQSDPFYSAENQKSLRKSINQLENGTGKQHNLIDEDQ